MRSSLSGWRDPEITGFDDRKRRSSVNRFCAELSLPNALDDPGFKENWSSQERTKAN
jgi:hypothetical protein